MSNVWNQLNVTTRQVAGEWAKLAEVQKWQESRSASRSASISSTLPHDSATDCTDDTD
jgi:hypothetical protein